MNDTPFHAIIALAELDTCLLALQEKRKKTESTLTSLRHEQESLHQSLENARNTAQSLRKKLHAQELESSHLQAAIVLKKKRLEQAGSPREYFSLNQECESLAAQLDASEDAALKLLDQTQQAEFFMHEEIKRTAQELQTLALQITVRTDELMLLDQEIAAKEHEREICVQKLPLEWHENYLSMREKVPNPLVSAQNGACPACFYGVATKDMADLHRHKLIPCRSCYRLLYIV